MIGFKQGFESAEFLIELFFFKKYIIQLSSPEVLKCLKLSETYISQYQQIFPSLAHTHTPCVYILSAVCLLRACYESDKC